MGLTTFCAILLSCGVAEGIMYLPIGGYYRLPVIFTEARASIPKNPGWNDAVQYIRESGAMATP